MEVPLVIVCYRSVRWSMDGLRFGWNHLRDSFWGSEREVVLFASLVGAHHLAHDRSAFSNSCRPIQWQLHLPRVSKHHRCIELHLCRISFYSCFIVELIAFINLLIALPQVSIRRFFVWMERRSARVQNFFTFSLNRKAMNWAVLALQVFIYILLENTVVSISPVINWTIFPSISV